MPSGLPENPGIAPPASIRDRATTTPVANPASMAPAYRLPSDTPRKTAGAAWTSSSSFTRVSFQMVCRRAMAS